MTHENILVQGTVDWYRRMFRTVLGTAARKVRRNRSHRIFPFAARTILYCCLFLVGAAAGIFYVDISGFLLPPDNFLSRLLILLAAIMAISMFRALLLSGARRYSRSADDVSA